MAPIKETRISEDRYIEIKKQAYSYYEQYNSLERRAREKFLEALPDMGSTFENDILINTLLFPDTEQLLMCTSGALQLKLERMGKNEDFITTHNIHAKLIEYSQLNTRKLIESGKLQIMDPIDYPDQSIGDKQYINLKNSALKAREKFCNLTLQEKSELLVQACEHKSYQAQIQIATLLIPNDVALMEQLKTSSISDVASHYMVPESIINFKIEEYNKQATRELINAGKVPLNRTNRLWYKDSIDDLINVLWDQSFYQSVEKEHTSKATTALESLFKNYSKTSTK